MNADERRGLGKALAAAMVASAVSTVSEAATPVPSGKWSFVFRDAKSSRDRPIRVFTYRPRKCDERCPIQLVMHGVNRDASNYRDHWELAADNYGVIIVAPEFSKEHWPGGASYNRGDVDATDDRARWAFTAIERLFDEVRVDQKDYRIFGHSAGAQFVHRFLYFVPENRASLAIAANAGWYTLPEWRADKAKFKWPHAVAGSKVGEKEVRGAFAKRLVVLLAEGDTDPDAANLDKQDGSVAQGANRLERGENFFAAATGLAREMSLPFAWELSYVPSTAHSGAAMSRAAADLVYGARK